MSTEDVLRAQNVGKMKRILDKDDAEEEKKKRGKEVWSTGEKGVFMSFEWIRSA